MKRPLDQNGKHAKALAPSRALSLDSYSFNFSVSTAQRLQAYGGPPAHILRLKAMEEAVERFYGVLEDRYAGLWRSAAAGNIDDDGRERRQTLLDDEGRDRIGELQHARTLFRERRDALQDRCAAFNRAWLRYLDHDFAGVAKLAARMQSFNEVFPVEADLAIDPKTGAYLWMGQAWRPLEPPGRDELLERFPLREPV